MDKENLLMELLRWKLKMAGRVVECLPPPVKSQAQQTLHGIVSACHQATEEFLAGEKGEASDAGVTPIPVE